MQKKAYILVAIVVILSMLFSATALAQSNAPGAGGFTFLPLVRKSDNVQQQGTIESITELAADSIETADSVKTENSSGLISVIVKLDIEPLASYSGGISGLAPTSPEMTGVTQLDLQSPSSLAYLDYVNGVENAFTDAVQSMVPNAQVTNRYDLVIGGASVVLPVDQLATLASLPGVKAVYPDELLQPDTENSPQFIGAPSTWEQLGGKESAGEGVVVGVLDTGIWPEHPSFSDPDPSGKPYVAPPNWHGTRCEFGSSVPGDVPFTCSNKLVGAARFMATYTALQTLLPDEYRSARDDDGHGTHTSSTSAGNANVAASVFGVPRGKVSGIAPRASVAMYKVCGATGCYSSDSAAAVQQAIRDGVNVINFSISGGSNPYADAVSIAFLDAFNAGIFVSASAGNSGPGADTTDHREPWVTTVAASTQNRAFQNTATLSADGGSSLTLIGASITSGVGPAPVYVSSTDPQCNNPYAAGSVAGMVVVCSRGTTGRAQKGWNVMQGGAVGMILYNQSTSVTDLETDNHFLPTTHIQYADGLAVLNFIATQTNVQATLTAGDKVAAQGDVMASFSSRGGPGQTLGVSKPDITAPGVQILAGHTPQHLDPSEDPALGPQGEWFQAIAGTSMSSPHIAGSGALLKALYPYWTPAQIKSALMLSAKTDVVKEDGVTPTNAFDDGSGRVNLSKAWKVGLTMNATGAEYVAHANDLWNANYPSVFVPVMPGIITVQRTVHNEKSYALWWKLGVQAPSDVKITVPSKIYLPENGDATFDITIDARNVPLGEVRFATLVMSDFSKTPIPLHIPITFIRKQASVTLAKTCTPASFALGSVTTCTITAANTTFTNANVSIADSLPKQLKLVSGSVIGGVESGNGVTFNGVLAGAQPPDVSVAAGTAPFGYFPLSGTPISGMGDETIANFNVPAFTFGGQTYTRVGMVSDGYLVVGGGTSADIQFVNQNLPNSTRPNNVLAPFWSDLNPAFGGAMRAAVLSSGSNAWIVFDWQGVVNYSNRQPNTFQVWLPYSTNTGTVNGVPANQTFFAFSVITTGDGGALTIGAENLFGNRGQNFYYNGTGTLPAPNAGVYVNSAPGIPGESKVISFQAKGVRAGSWTNYALLTSDIFQGTNVASFSGTVTP